MPRSRPLSHQSGGHPASHAKGKAHRRRHGLIAFLQGFWGRSVFSLIQGLFPTVVALSDFARKFGLDEPSSLLEPSRMDRPGCLSDLSRAWP